MIKQNIFFLFVKKACHVAGLCLALSFFRPEPVPLIASNKQETTLFGTFRINGLAVENAVVYLVSTDKERPKSLLMEKTIVQKNTQFKPAFTMVTQGSTIYFENHDDKIHNVYSAHPPNRFDIGAHLAHTTKSIVLKAAGIVALRCKVHERMKAWIYVFPSPFFALTDAKGHFEISGIPFGRYNIEPWFFNLSPQEIVAGTRTLDLFEERMEVRIQLNAANPDKDFSNILNRDWMPVIGEIKTALDKALAQWEKKKRTSAAVHVMTAHSKLFHGSGFRQAIAENQGEEKVEKYDAQFDNIRKAIQGMRGENTGTPSIQKEIDDLLSYLTEEAKAIDHP